MKNDKDKPVEDMVEAFVKDKAHTSARAIVEEAEAKASREVDARLRYLEPPPRASASIMPPAMRCGMKDVDAEDVQEGLEKLFQRYFRQGMGALNRGDASTACFYLGKCLLLPVSDELKMRQMVRHNLRLSLSMRNRQNRKTS